MGEPGKICASCRHWHGRRKHWMAAGTATGACKWLSSLTNAPPWVLMGPAVRITYEDDGGDCLVHEQSAPNDQQVVQKPWDEPPLPPPQCNTAEGG